MYIFAPINKLRAIETNVKLVWELKDKFGFVYAVCFFISWHIYPFTH
jgi:hypothetical protein